MFNMTVEGSFSAAHAIREYPGVCQRLHGHNYRVVVRLTGDKLDKLGMLVDYVDVKRALTEALSSFDHRYLNEVDDFLEVNPTCEELARVIYRRFKAALLTTDDLRGRVAVADVTIYESEKTGVGYGE